MNGDTAGGETLNDVHSRLNATVVAEVARPTTLSALQRAVRRAGERDRAVCIVGGRHAMGGQQVAAGAVAIDMSGLNRVLALDGERGTVDVEAGIHWPELIAQLVRDQTGSARPWGIRQKQTGADRLTLGGSLAANAHGRGLAFKPIVADVAGFTLVDAQGEVRWCDRQENAELFRLAIGGYGLFGVIATVRLRLAPRVMLERVVVEADVEAVMEVFRQRIADGFLYGDFQFSIDPTGDDFLRHGVLSCYRPVPDRRNIPAGQRRLSRQAWQELIYLAHVDKPRAVAAYTAHYRATSGQLYWSDTHQLSEYVDGYHLAVDRRLGGPAPATEIIGELYVRGDDLPSFLVDARADFRAHDVDVVYGTVRLITRDDETFLAWAKDDFACVVFNLHTRHTPAGVAHTAAAFRRLIDLAIARGGSYFLTYHRFATPDQVLACYPQFAAFLRLKQRHDPVERFQSEWYRHYRQAFAGR